MLIMAEVRTDMCKEHPGKEIERLIQADGISRKELADRTGVTEKYVNELLAGENDITEGFARKPGKIFAACPEGSANHSKDAKYWQGLQYDYDLYVQGGKGQFSTSEKYSILVYILKFFTDIGRLLSLLKCQDSAFFYMYRKYFSENRQKKNNRYCSVIKKYGRVN